MNNDQNYFFYPEDLKRQALFFGWSGRDLAIIASAVILSVFLFFLTFIWLPLLLSALYAMLTFTVEEQSLAKHIRRYFNYLFLDQLEYTWGEPEPLGAKKGE